MKKNKNCEIENCIPTPSSCVTWNGGDIEYLGLCDGESLNNVMWEIIHQLEDIAGNDLSEFDIDSLAEICNKNAPNEVTLLSILNLVKDNQICLKDFIDTLSEQLASILNTQNVNINLKCYAEFDNLGNSLSITRSQLDQLIIDNLCNHKGRIEFLEGEIINLQNQINNIQLNTTVEELSFATCENASVQPTSQQVISLAEAFCDLRTSTGDSAAIASALANTPAGMNAEFGALPGWIMSPTNLAQNYNNLLIAFGNIWARLEANEVCCEATCKDVELGFSAVYNEDNDGIIITFSAGAGTEIPAGFTDQGSSGTITDIDGNIVSFNLTIANNSTHEVMISGLNLTGPLEIDITAILGNDGLTCQKCIHRKVNKATCDYCQICVTGTDGTVVIVYDDNGGAQAFESFNPSTTTTTTTVEV